MSAVGRTIASIVDRSGTATGAEGGSYHSQCWREYDMEAGRLLAADQRKRLFGGPGAWSKRGY